MMRSSVSILYEESRNMAPKLIVAFLLVGILCYWQARHLTAPIIKLRAAARKLAEGDLTVRAGRDVERRRDEISDLGRDFNFMAERIESLMTNQRRLLRDVSHKLRSHPWPDSA
jgi:two-component system, OmpR family, sensor histidine kinase CpxA